MPLFLIFSTALSLYSVYSCFQLCRCLVSVVSQVFNCIPMFYTFGGFFIAFLFGRAYFIIFGKNMYRFRFFHLRRFMDFPGATLNFCRCVFRYIQIFYNRYFSYFKIYCSYVAKYFYPGYWCFSIGYLFVRPFIIFY